jgi:capsular exopolysaccharide synthesis family protein
LARYEIAIREYWYILKKRRQLVIFCAVFSAMIGVAFYYLSALAPAALLNPPKSLTAGITGLVAGIVLGLILILIVESFGTSLGAIEAVEEAIGTRVLGVIPLADTREIISCLKARSSSKAVISSLKNFTDLVAHYAPNAVISESFRVLRTNILSSEQENRIKAIAITSASPGEGRTATSVNLAISFAQAGFKTLLVEADLRRPAFAKIFGIEELTGITDIVLGNFSWRDTVKGVTDIIMGKMPMDEVMMTPGLDHLNIITSGGRPPNPAEMIGSRVFTDFLDEAKHEYDYIILDSPPVLSVTDAAVLGEKADAVLLVFRTGAVSRSLLKRAAARLEQAKCKPAGVILNCSKPEVETNYQGEYRDGPLNGIFSFSLKKRAADETQPDRCGIKSSWFLRGVVSFLALALITAGVLYLNRMQRAEKKQEGIKWSGEDNASSESVKPEEKAAIVKEPQPPQAQITVEQKMSNQRPEIKVEVSHENVTVPESAYQPSGLTFSVYLGSFKTGRKAEETVSLNKQQGIDSFWVRVKHEDIGTWYRIYAGCFKDRGQAESFIDEHDFEEAEIKETSYANLIGSFKTQEDLNAKVQSIEDLGYSTYSIKGADGAYNLFTGAFITAAGAEEQNRELKSAGIESSVVRR